MSDQTPNDPSSTPPGPPPSAPPPPPPSAPPVGDYSAPQYATTGAQPVPAAGGAPNLLSPMWQGPGTPPPPGWQPQQKNVARLLRLPPRGLRGDRFFLGKPQKGIIPI